MKSYKIKDNIFLRTVILILTVVCLCTVSIAMAISSSEIKNNYFNTGKVDINLNDGNYVFEENEYIFEPGATVRKEFFVENNSTWEVWYKVYFDNVKGELADKLVASIYDGNTILWKGNLTELKEANVEAAEKSLLPGQKKNLVLELHLPRIENNNSQNLRVYFDILSEAVQTKNNPNKLFE